MTAYLSMYINWMSIGIYCIQQFNATATKGNREAPDSRD